MLTLREKSAEALILQFHPEPVHKVVSELRKNGYPDAILDLVRGRNPLVVLSKKGIYDLVDKNGSTVPFVRLMYHGDENRLSSLEVKHNKRWHLELLGGTKPKSIFDTVRKRFPDVALVRYRGPLPEPYLVVDGHKIKLKTMHDRSLQTIPSKLTVSERAFQNGRFALVDIDLIFHGYKIKLYQENIMIGTKSSGFMSDASLDLVRGRFKVNVQFTRTEEQRKFRIEYAYVHVLSSSEVRMSREVEEEYYYDDF